MNIYIHISSFIPAHKVAKQKKQAVGFVRIHLIEVGVVGLFLQGRIYQEMLVVNQV